MKDPLNVLIKIGVNKQTYIFNINRRQSRVVNLLFLRVTFASGSRSSLKISLSKDALEHKSDVTFGEYDLIARVLQVLADVDKKKMGKNDDALIIMSTKLVLVNNGQVIVFTKNSIKI